MDATEAHAQRYLEHRGHHGTHHPDGRGTPPDFLVDGRIAVEVRRLDQGFTIEGRRQSLEQTYMPLREIFTEMLPSLGPPVEGRSWYVMFKLRRPIDPWPTVKKQLHQILADFKGAPSTSNTGNIRVCRGLTVQFWPASKPFGQFYVLGGPGDGDAGGWVVSEIIGNVGACIAEKTATVARVHAKYSQWWLVLANRIYPDIDADDMKDIRAHIVVPTTWNKVILVSMWDHTQALEL